MCFFTRIISSVRIILVLTVHLDWIENGLRVQQHGIVNLCHRQMLDFAHRHFGFQSNGATLS